MRKIITKNVRLPSIIIPYAGPILELGAQDVFLYLRPESNGVLIESLLMRVIKSDMYSKKCSVVYLANMPGDFMIKNRIIEQHYSLKIRFARLGKIAFTRAMQEKFEKIFLISFREAKIIGALAALRLFNLSYEELFKLWVPPHHFAIIDGQTIKKYDGHYIVNYDIPAILHRNSRRTDFAVMLFRSLLTRTEFHYMVEDMHNQLVAENIIKTDRPLSRTFHYSAGPFEQILDGIGYLYDQEARHLPVESISFFAYLLDHGVTKEAIMKAMKNPIMQFRGADNEVFEENLFSYTIDETFKGALEKYLTRV
jgi:hypothetical protein